MSARILLVDDDAELTELLRDYLEREGFAVRASHDGATGVTAALSNRYDIVVLDIMMPGMSGIEALCAISLAGREGLDNLVFVINCNLQRLDGPVRGNGKIVQELKARRREPAIGRPPGARTRRGPCATARGDSRRAVARPRGNSPHVRGYSRPMSATNTP